MFKLSTYWKCQLIGWSVYGLILYVANNIIFPDYIGFLYKMLVIILFGIISSHLLRISIKRLRIFNYQFAGQIIYLSILTLVFSLAITFVWLFFLIKTGIYKYPVEGALTPFYKIYIFNLLFVLATTGGWSLIYFLVHYMKNIRQEEQQKLFYKYQAIELEATALRAQINPHFIFNCMNSIKSLIQQNEQNKAVTYLTTFSKLIRTIFENSDKREISLFDELETCRLYTALESMRFGKKLNYAFNIKEGLDLKSIMVPAMIVQPFIENSIWHGIMPKADGGSVNITVDKTDHKICCIIDDDGIGRETSGQNKFKGDTTRHRSKGMHLTQARLDLDNLLNERNANVEIRDKKEHNGKPAGTVVILTFKEY